MMTTSPPAPSPPPVTGHLELVAAMMQEFTRSGGFEGMVRHGLRRVTRQLGASASALYLLSGREDGSGLAAGEGGGADVLSPGLSPLPGSSPAGQGPVLCRASCGLAFLVGLELPAGEQLVAACLDSDRAQRAVYTPPRRLDNGLEVCSELVAPLTLGDQRLGAVQMLNKQGGEDFSDDDRQLLVALASAAALAIANIRLAHRLAGQQRLQRELELAADIQRGLLPSPRGEDFPLHGANLPLSAVSGDFYDVVERDDGWLWAAAADVSGKGMNAALLMAKTSSLFRCLAKEPALTPGSLLARISDELCETSSHGMFVTMVCLACHPASGAAVLANAGHEWPLVHDLTTGTLTPVRGGGPPLGLFPRLHGAAVEESRLTLAAGQRLLVLTDGLSEARNRLGTPVSPARLENWLAACAPAPLPLFPRLVIDSLLDDGWVQRDDMTALVWQQGPLPPQFVLSLAGEAASLALLRCFVRAGFLRYSAGMSGGGGVPGEALEGAVGEMVSAVDEAAQNIIRHSYHGGGPHCRLEARLWQEEGQVVVELTDHGEPVPSRVVEGLCGDKKPLPPARESWETRRAGGLGLLVIRSLADRCQLEPLAGGGSRLRLWKKLPGTGSSPAAGETGNR